MKRFSKIWFYDFEFNSRPGEIPEPVCMVAKEYFSQKTVKIWFRGEIECPFDFLSNDELFCAYFSTAELSCHLALGWPLPKNVLDLFVEYRVKTNGLPNPGGLDILSVAKMFGLQTLESSYKTSMRDLVLSGGPWSDTEKIAIINYCESDVVLLEGLFGKMKNEIDMSRALFRGRYMTAVARMEHRGVPIDLDMLEVFREKWDYIKDNLIGSVDAQFGVYEGTTFKRDRWYEYLNGKGISWPQLPTGRLDMTDETFSEMSRRHPQLIPLKELRATLSKLRLSELAVGHDGRNRCLLSPFRSKTGRNQPSNAKFIFGPSKWLRSLIKPPPGHGLAYIDWSQQEFGIAGALSGDTRMQAAYHSGDPYLEFAKQVGAAPPNATKKSHEHVRALYKECSLGVQYGMGEESLANRIQKSVPVARQLLKLHRENFCVFWKWIDAAVDHAMIQGSLSTVFGWKIRVGISGETNPRSLRNFPMQANGAELLRLACIMGTEKGIRICAPIHDAILIEAKESELEESVETMQQIMEEASRVVLSGFTLRSDATLFRSPDRYCDGNGWDMWNKVMGILDEDSLSVELGTCAEVEQDMCQINTPG